MVGVRCPAAFLSVADEDYGRQIPFAFLERIQTEWKEKLADKARTATAHSLDKTFGCAHFDKTRDFVRWRPASAATCGVLGRCNWADDAIVPKPGFSC